MTWNGLALGVGILLDFDAVQALGDEKERRLEGCAWRVEESITPEEFQG